MTAILNALVKPYSFYQFRVAAESFGKVFSSPFMEGLEKDSSFIHKAIKMAPEKHFLTSSPYYNQAKFIRYTGEVKSFLGACGFFANFGNLLGHEGYFGEHIKKKDYKTIFERIFLLTANLSECLSYFQGKFNIFQNIENVQIGQFKIFKPLAWIANNKVESGFGAAGLTISVIKIGQKLVDAFKKNTDYHDKPGFIKFLYDYRLPCLATVEKTLKVGLALTAGSFTKKSYANHPVFITCGLIAAAIGSYRAHYFNWISLHKEQVDNIGALNGNVSVLYQRNRDLAVSHSNLINNYQTLKSERDELLEEKRRLNEQLDTQPAAKKGGKTK